MRPALALRALGVGLFIAGCGFPDYTFKSGNGVAADGHGDATSDAHTEATIEGAAGRTDGAGATDARPDAPKGCTANAECSPLLGGILCDTSDGACVECRPARRDCPAGARCTANRVCEVGCDSDADCVGVPSVQKEGGAPRDAASPDGGDAASRLDGGTRPSKDAGRDSSSGRDASEDSPSDGALDGGDGGDAATRLCDLSTHTCVGCRGDADCPKGTYCDAALERCTSGCSAERPCPDGFLCCDGQCFDPDHAANHCGSCTVTCEREAGLGACIAGLCRADSCRPGFGDCNGDPRDGCETDLRTDVTHCGACGSACPTPRNAAAICQGGVCGLGPCLTSFANCDVDPATGCEANLEFNGTNCGSCGFACNLLNANQRCNQGECVVTNCHAGFADCDGILSTGCEVDTQSDPSNCGACGKICSFINAAATCSSGACVIGACTAPAANCNADPTDGCETNTSSDPDNCGACASHCVLAHATAACTDGKCVVASCEAGFGDCDGVDSDGCETNVQTSAKNCSACGVPCSTNNATPTCALASCSVKCVAGFDDCDGDPSNGCETDTSANVEHCGDCTKICPSIGGTPNCVDGTCGISACGGTLADCNGSPGDGCEVDTATSVANCGGCGKACFAPNGTANCVGSTCGIAGCATGFGNCNGDVSDGCETRLNTLSQCGGCNAPCALSHAISTCLTGRCDVGSCVTPYADCDGQASNGCEVDTSTDVKNCGGCDVACDSTNGTAKCVNGACTITCNAGFGNCNASPSDGCERATRDDVNNCGACGAVCAVQNGKPACNGTTCSISSCTAPFADCDHVYATGCETNTDTRIDNCGSCGHACDTSRGTPSCTSGVCITP